MNTGPKNNKASDIHSLIVPVQWNETKEWNIIFFKMMEKSHTLQILWESASNIGKFDIALKEWGKLQIPTFRLCISEIFRQNGDQTVCRRSFWTTKNLCFGVKRPQITAVISMAILKGVTTIPARRRAMNFTTPKRRILNERYVP